jgi:hypothetical protein
MKQLTALRRRHRALRVGNFRPISSDRLFAFERYTDRAGDTVLVLVNPSDVEVSETLMVANSKLMDGALLDLLDPQAASLRQHATLMQVTLAPHSFRVLQPDVAPPGGYTNYKRVQ